MDDTYLKEYFFNSTGTVKCNGAYTEYKAEGK